MLDEMMFLMPNLATEPRRARLSASVPPLVKTTSDGSAPTSAATAAAQRLYLRETSFYRELAPRLGTPTPLCYFAEIDDSNHFMIILDDMSPTLSVDQFSGLTLEQTRHGLVALASLHSGTTNDNELFARESVPRRIRAETPLSEIACAMVSSGQGISVVDPFTAREFERRGVVARRFLPAVEFQVTLLYSRRRGLSPLAREFADAVERSIREFKREFAVAR